VKPSNLKKVTSLYLDISKAFDRSHEGLILKVFSLNIPGNITRVLAICLKVVRFTKNTTNSVLSSVPQGSVIGPTLFPIHINDVADRPDTKLTLFADDTALLARDYIPRFPMQKLQRHILLLEQCCIKWRIYINLDKTIAILFTRCFYRHMGTYLN
jgi:hypothetical protein